MESEKLLKWNTVLGQDKGTTSQLLCPSAYFGQNVLAPPLLLHYFFVLLLFCGCILRLAQVEPKQKPIKHSQAAGSSSSSLVCIFYAAQKESG